MHYRQLGVTDVQVSQLCLGTMTWGEQNSEQEAHAQLDYALDQGINFIDTAELYPVPPRGETYTLTEQYIGNWLSRRGNRDQIVLATKIASRGDWISHIREGRTRLNGKFLQEALEGSLRRLKTDYVDLYQLHWPDRKTNYFGHLGYSHDPDDIPVAIEETLAELDKLVRAGKIRHIGLSNETPWGVMRFLALSESRGWPRIVSVQNPFNLLNRSYEVGLAEISERERCGLLAYSPLGFGVLSGKYLHGARPAGARITLFQRFDRYNNPQAVAATEAYVNLAREYGLDPVQMALAYVNTRSFLTSNIIGATSLQQLEANIRSLEVSLSVELLAAIEAIHVRIPNPSP